MNSVNLTGRMTHDPELKMTPQGTAVCTFSIRVQRPHSKKDESGNYPVDFIRCTAWRQTAEFVRKYFKKGSRIGIPEAMLITNQYTDKDSGKKITNLEVLVSSVEFLDSKRGATTADPTASTSQMPSSAFTAPNDDSDGDLPF